MHKTTRSSAFTATTLAMVLGLAACGGGGGDAAVDATSADVSDKGLATAQARTRPAPPPPPPPDATLRLVSASASGLAADGQLCAVSADGAKVLFASRSANLVSGDTNGLADLFLKDLNGNSVIRVVASATLNGSTCLGMTPDANVVAYVADVGSPGAIFPAGPVESAILVKNLATGQTTRVTPPLATFANVASFQFAGISDDGLRIAFIAQPTRSCSGYDCTANGPARMLLRELATGQLVNLESRVRFTTSQGVANGDAWLAPNGRTLAFSSSAAYPEAGDTTANSDVYALDLASGSVRLVNADAAGRQISITGTVSPTYGVQAFLSNSGKIAFFTDYDTSAGQAGVYVKDLASGALDRVLGRNLTYSVGNRAALSFSDDGRKVAYVESTGNTLNGTSVPRLRDLVSGALLNLATLSNGTASNGLTTSAPLLSRDGRTAAFDNNATNLVAGAAKVEYRTYRKLLP